jgi:predicted hotdog family 3-hydroxylacyl-ACP dehydratase
MDAAGFLDLPAEQLTTHQAPALLIERALVLRETGGRVRVKPHDGLDCLQLTEACAQAMAVIMGLRLRGSGDAAQASGMLVGAKGMTLTRAARPGEVVEIDATQSAELGPLQLYEVRAAVGDDVLLTGELKVVRTGGPS